MIDGNASKSLKEPQRSSFKLTKERFFKQANIYSK